MKRSQVVDLIQAEYHLVKVDTGDQTHQIPYEIQTPKGSGGIRMFRGEMCTRSRIELYLLTMELVGSKY
jgi:hypothetical protein